MNCLLHNTKRYSFKPKVMCQLFDAFVGSILSYSCEIWGFGKCKEIERIHLKFCKYLLKVKSSTCNIGVYGELERYPLYVTRYTRIIKFWCHIINTDNILVNKLYSSLVDACSTGENACNWSKNVKSLLDKYGFSFVWSNPFSVDLKHFICSLNKEYWMFLNKAGIAISPTTESLHFIKTTNCLSIMRFI